MSAKKDVTQTQTCTEKEIATLTATFQNEIFEEQVKTDVETAAKGHSFGEWTVVQEATFTEKGSKHRVCSACQEEEVEEIDKLDAVSYFVAAVEAIDPDAALETFYESLVQASEYYDYIDDKTAVADEYAVYNTYSTRYTTLIQSIRSEYQVAKEIENKYFTAILQIVQYISLAAYVLLQGKRWFL